MTPAGARQDRLHHGELGEEYHLIAADRKRPMVPAQIFCE